MNVDILVIMAHPDDAELCCSGTILASINQGLTVGLVDLTRGESVSYTHLTLPTIYSV